MRFFRKNKDSAPGGSAEDIAAPRVEDGIVYDENGEVLYAEPTSNLDTDPFGSEAPAFPDPDAQDIFADSHPEETAADTFDDRDREEVTARDDIFADANMAPETALATDLEISLAAGTPTVNVSDAQDADAPIEDRIDDTAEPAPSVEPPLLHKRVNLSELRVDVARITSDIQSGERLYQRAQQRVESLMGFVERAEVDFSLLNRLEPENRRLKARNRVLEAENEAATHHTRRLERELSEAQEEAATARSNFDSTRARLTAATSSIEEKDREIARLTHDMEQASLRVERSQTNVEVESRENIVLRDQITDLSSRLDEVTSERMELAKIVESLKIDCDDHRAQKEQSASEVSDLRVALATAQKINGEMKTQMVSLHEEIKGFKTQYEFNVISREDRIANLENRIADLTKQVSIKEDVAKSALADVAQLRKTRSAQDLERERLERVIEAQQRQIDEAQAQIQRSTNSMADLDQRYNDVAAALSVYQKRITPDAGPDAGLAAPLSPPPPFESKAASGEVDPTLTPENVEDMIMDYKLGLRSQLG